MTPKTLSAITRPLTGSLHMIGDKSISHRAIIFGAIAKGTTHITNLLESDDTLHTIKLFQQMGVTIKKQDTSMVIEGHGIEGLKQPEHPLYLGNSGTTARLIIGLLSGLSFHTTLYGDESLTMRPMDRVINPIRKMGAHIEGKQKEMFLPLNIEGQPLKGITYEMPVKSAQVKSSLLLAGHLASSQITITEPSPTRNHTELMFKSFGANLSKQENSITLKPQQHLTGCNLNVPGDISSAAFWIVAALIVPKSEIKIKNVGLNETRTGILDVCKAMGACIDIENVQIKHNEKRGDLLIKQQKLNGVTIKGDLIPRLIDEIPIIALLATQAEGDTIIRHAEELKVKETDRIKAIVTVLTTLGADVISTEDGMIIRGKSQLSGGQVSSYGDHRIAMMIVIASLIANHEVFIDDISSIAISYPHFFKDLNHFIRL